LGVKLSQKLNLSSGHKNMNTLYKFFSPLLKAKFAGSILVASLTVTAFLTYLDMQGIDGHGAQVATTTTSVNTAKPLSTDTKTNAMENKEAIVVAVGGK
jgi:hypothetical protein